MSSLQNCRLAALQMVSGPRVDDNLRIAAQLVDQAVNEGAQLLVLPEYFPIIGATDEARLAARETYGNGPIQNWLRQTSIDKQIWLVAGSIPLSANDPNKLRNSCLVYNPQGECVARYDKMHLFSFHKGAERYDEAVCIEPGNQPVAFDTPFGRIALSICYDLRFPEYYRQLGPLDLILMPAAFTDTTGRAHWEPLLRTRAIENQCYLLAAGQGGRHENGRLTHGNSMIIDPWGEILDRKQTGTGIVVAELNHRRLAAVREALPALTHRLL